MGASGATFVAAVELLSPVSVSDEVVVTLAVLLSGPDAVGFTTIVTVVACPGPRLPIAHVTLAVPAQLPCPAALETNVTPAGSGSITLTPVAGLAVLLFFTASV